MLTRRDLFYAAVAGVVSSALQSALMSGRHALGILRGFEPAAVLQKELAQSVGWLLPEGWGWGLSLLTGALIWSAIFSWAYEVIPGQTPLTKGFAVGLFAWLVTGCVIFPLMGLGVFAQAVGLGVQPAVLMLVMLMSYCLTLSLVYGYLRARS